MLRTNFNHWYNNEFSQTEMFQNMLAVAENSPWHREANVGVHTNMVVAEYISNTHYEPVDVDCMTNIDLNEWDTNDVIGALACAFHDVGKPAASERNGIKWKPERGNYLSFGSHELISARMWEDFAVENWARFEELFGLLPRHIHMVAWIIEHHLPWAIKKDAKRKVLAQTVATLGIADVYASVLIADTWGRISDDGPEKKQKVLEWIGEFLDLVREQPGVLQNVLNDSPTLMMPIAPSGAGKSSFRNTLPDDTEMFSMDDLRIEMYCDDIADVLTDEDYNRAYTMSTNDKGFNQAVQNRFNECIATGNNVFCDNTNTSARRRRHYITEARRKGYRIQAILLPIDLATLVARQTTRTDKTVPTHAVVAQYMGMQMPSYGDFDSIIVLDGNL